MQTNCILPEEVIESILTRLPVRDLLRFRCICKSWCALIDHPTFVRSHYHFQYAIHKAKGDVPLLLFQSMSYKNPCACYILFRHQEDDVLVNLIEDLESDAKLVLNYQENLNIESAINVRCVGIANGIVCFKICFFFDGNNRGYCALWNPTIRDLKLISCSIPDILEAHQEHASYTCVIGFGFDELSNDFKVVAIFISLCTNESLAYGVYSLSTGSWKILTYLQYLVRPTSMDACLNGVHYWVAMNTNSNDSMFNIVSFNFSTELFNVSDPPQCADIPTDYQYPEFIQAIGLYKECLALIFTRRILGAALAKVDIWVVTKFSAEDFGVPLEWQCLLVIEPFPVLFEDYLVKASRVDGLLLLNTIDDDDTTNTKWTLYDPESRKMQNLRIGHIDYGFRYVESLFPLSRIGTQT